MHFRSLYLFALNAFIARTLATPAALSASTLDISKRLYFPGCIAALGSLNTGPCTCKCDSGYDLTADKHYHQESEMMCQASNGNFYGPIGKPITSTKTRLKCSLCATLSQPTMFTYAPRTVPGQLADTVGLTQAVCYASPRPSQVLRSVTQRLIASKYSDLKVHQINVGAGLAAPTVQRW